MMKKLVWILIFALLLSGCSTVVLEKPSPEETVQPETIPTPPSEPVPEDEAEEVPVPEEPAFPPVVLMNRLGAAATLIDYTPDDPWGPTMLLELKNETTGPLCFAIDSALANGVMCDPYWSCEVPAGETMQSRVRWSSEQLALSGIAWLNELSINLLVTDPGDAESRPLFCDAVELTLAGGEEAAPLQWAGTPPQLLAEGNGFRILARLVTTDGNGNAALTLELVNEGSCSLLVTAQDVAIDGTDTDPGWGDTVIPQAVRFSQMLLDISPDSRILTMTLCVYDGDDWLAEDLFCNTVSIDLRSLLQ